MTAAGDIVVSTLQPIGEISARVHGGKMRRSISVTLVVLLLSLVIPASAAAQGVPQLPARYWGTVKIYNEVREVDAPQGTIITALVDGVERGSITVTEPGKYGGPTGLDPKLSVQGDISQGDLVEFYVNGVKADQTANFQNDHPEEINLTVYIAPAVGGGGGGGGGAPPPPATYIETKLFGTGKSFPTSQSGEIMETIEGTSEDGTLALTIPEGTIALDEGNNPLGNLEITPDASPPPPPENASIIGLAYDFEPKGATFNPPIEVEYTYDPDDLPGGVAEENLVLAYYDEDKGEWVELPSTVDLVTHTITASVSHFTTFAIIAAPPPPSTAAAPAAFSVSSLSIQPAEVQPKEAVTITVSVANTSGTEGSYTVVLKINDVKEAAKSLTIAADSSQSVSFSITKEDAGSYRVAVDELSGSFTVIAPAPPVLVSPAPVSPTPVSPAPPAKPIKWPALGGVIVGVVVVGLLIFFLVVRKRAY